MKTEEFEIIKKERIDGETIEDCYNRLKLQGRFEVKYDSLPAKQELQCGNNNIDICVDFSMSDFIIPQIKIIQDQSKVDKDVPRGVFFNLLTRECKDKMEKVTFLKRSNGRVLFPTKDFTGNRLCWSDDGKYPSHEVPSYKNSICETCKFAEWSTDEQGKPERPLCKETISFIGMEQETSDLFWMVFSGDSIKSVKYLLTSLIKRVMLGKIKNENLGMKDFQFDILTRKGDESKGNYWIPAFDNISRVEKEKTTLVEDILRLIKKPEVFLLEKDVEIPSSISVNLK